MVSPLFVHRWNHWFESRVFLLLDELPSQVDESNLPEAPFLGASISSLVSSTTVPPREGQELDFVCQLLCVALAVRSIYFGTGSLSPAPSLGITTFWNTTLTYYTHIACSRV